MAGDAAERLEELKLDDESFSSSSASLLLSLPSLLLDAILARLPAADLARCRVVCRAWKERCSDEDLWWPFLARRWGCLGGRSAQEDIVRQWYFAEDARPPLSKSKWAWYSVLEGGLFEFRAQIYNREQRRGFTLSAFDAHVRYVPETDCFTARYFKWPGEEETEEFGIEWNRVRATTPEHNHPLEALVCSDIEHAQPGDHVEVQWKMQREQVFGWWYGVIGHLDLCSGGTFCKCKYSGRVQLLFQQYKLGSPWRTGSILRSVEGDQPFGDGETGYIGGLRIITEDTRQIQEWLQFFPEREMP